jgi:hypothetical protein
VRNRSVRLGKAVAETSPHGRTGLNIALTGTASASTEAGVPGVERDRRECVDGLVLDGMDRQPHGPVRARYVKIEVTDDDGTPPCIGEFRLFAPAPMDTITDRGVDLSFELQEEAAGAHFSDGGGPASALSILDAHGLNYVRLRLWVNPPP